jgi:hypothetical protein
MERTYSFNTASPPCRTLCSSAVSYVVDEVTVGAWCGRPLADDGVAAYGDCTGANYSLTEGYLWFVLGERPSEQSQNAVELEGGDEVHASRYALKELQLIRTNM